MIKTILTDNTKILTKQNIRNHWCLHRQPAGKNNCETNRRSSNVGRDHATSSRVHRCRISWLLSRLICPQVLTTKNYPQILSNISNNTWSQILSTMTSCQQGALPLTGNCARTLVKNAATHISGVTRWASWAWRWNFKFSWYCEIEIISLHNFVKSGSLEGSLRPTSTVGRGTWLMTWWKWKC